MLQLKRGSHSDLSTSGIVLESGQAAYEIDTHRLKIGDGVLQYPDLPYIGSDNSYLPLSGGAMSGWIRFPNGVGISCNNSTGQEETVLLINSSNSLNFGNSSFDGNVILNCNSNYHVLGMMEQKII